MIYLLISVFCCLIVVRKCSLRKFYFSLEIWKVLQTNDEIKAKYFFTFSKLPFKSLKGLDLHLFYFSALACNIICNHQSLITVRKLSFSPLILLKKGAALSREYEIRSRLPGHHVLGGAQEIRSFLIHRTL